MKKFRPFLEDVPLDYANEHPQFYRNKAREDKWGAPVYFVPSTNAYDVTGTSGPYYKYGHNATEKLGKYGNCTWFCLGRHHENSGEVLSAIIGDAGKTFGKYTGRKEGSLTQKIYIGDSIQDGDMLVFADNLDNTGCGHIAYVEQVDEDIIHISESGYSTKFCYKDKTCITYTLDKEDLITSTKISLRPVQPYSEYLYGVIHTGDCYKEKKEMFTRRYSKPTSKDKSYVLKQDGGWNDCVVGSPTDSQCRCLANCVGYASGRYNEIYNELSGKSGCNYPYLNCNAENFIERVKKFYPSIKIDSTPEAGSIMCWQKGTLDKSDGAGHVAIVEEVIDSNTVKTSESSYGGTAFYNKTRTKGSDGNWGLAGKYSFRAFIHPPISEDPTPTPTSDLKVGDKVIATGKLYTSSNGSTSSGSIKNKTTYITRYAAGTKHPYNTTGDLGWMDASSLTKVEEKIVLPTPVSKTTNKDQVYIPAGMSLRIRKGPGTNYAQIGLCKPNSYYNVLEVCEEDDYDWYKLNDNSYIAGVDGVIYYPKETKEALKKKLAELEAKQTSLEAELKTVKAEIKEIKAKL